MIKINVGSCDLPLPQPWINVDISTSPHIKSDLVLDGRKLSDHFQEESVDEIYAGHFVEHLTPVEAHNWMCMCFRLLKPGGKLGFVTPDFHYLAQAYLDDDIPLERMTNLYVFSYEQESHHASLWDPQEQWQALAIVGFRDIREIDRMSDDRLAYPAVWQCGTEGRKL